MKKEFDALVFIGRMQPFHSGHEAIIRRGLELAEEVIVVLGSSFSPRTPKNPFTFEERKAMVTTVFPSRVKVVPVIDYPYNDNKWIAAVQSVVRSALPHTNDPEKYRKVGLIGHSKDSSSYYINIFNGWKPVNVPAWNNPDTGEVLNATDIRKAMFEQDKKYFGTVNREVMNLIHKIDLTNVIEEYKAIKEYKKIWSAAPFPPTFVTADAVVVQSGKVLLVKRGGNPGKGLWALPGGFINPDEPVFESAIRELKEETGLKVPEKVLRRMEKKSAVFDHPDRSLRGRTITHAFFFDLGNEPKMPKVKGMDDAVDAKWVDFADIRTDNMFEDHAHIIDNWLNIL